MTRLTILAASFFATLPAWAHPGHIAESHGHTHFADYGVMALVAASAVFAILHRIVNKHK